MMRDRRKMLKITMLLFGVSAIGGFLMYAYCYLLSANSLKDVLVAALRGIFNTMRMYFVDIDYEVLTSALGEQFLNDNVWLKVCFFVLHITAMVVVQVVLLSLFGRKLIDYCR